MTAPENDKNEITSRTPGDPSDEPGAMSLFEHLQELRTRIIYSVAAWLFFSGVGWFLSKQVITFFKSYPQLSEVQLILIRPPEAFFVRMKTAMLVGFLIALPFILYQALAFVVPGLDDNERKWTYRLVMPSILLFYLGAAFGVYVMLPVTLEFFLVHMTEGLASPQISLGEYVNYLMAIVLVGGFVFQTPIVLFFLTLIGVLSSEKLRTGRRYAIIIIFIIAALASPPDPFSQVIVAVPMLILYEMCIWMSKLAGK